jgi:hypothetical protein
MKKREQGVVLDFHDVLFQLASPNKVFGSFRSETVMGKRRKDGVVCGKRACSYMKDSEPSAWVERYRSQCNAGGHVVNWNHVYSVVDIGNESKLNASLREAPDEVIRVSDW